MTTETIIEEKTTTYRTLKEPPKYKVVVFNDDYTPMEFVVAMFITIFHKNKEEAMALTMSIHTKGNAVAGVYSHEIAEQKVSEATSLARGNGHPLVLKAEEE